MPFFKNFFLVETMLRVSIAILKLAQSHLLKQVDLEEILKLLKGEKL
jgi:hypothetical protein